MTDPTDPGEPPETAPDSTEDMAALPASRRRGQRLPKEPTQDELDALPVEKRLELIDRRRVSIHGTLNSIGIVLTVLFTAVTVVTTQQELRTSQQGQITDRYTKAVDQLGSTKLDIRLGGIYALERLATDSPRDDRTVYDVLCAFVREHDPKPRAKIPDHPATDIQAALTVIGRRKPFNDGFTADLNNIRTPQADLTLAKLPNANLFGADLFGAFLLDANLSGANLANADLSGADLTRANLANAKLFGADLTRADLTIADLANASLFDANLTRANLPNANLHDAALAGANLSGADLYGANLTVAQLHGANLSGADLSGADLRGAYGMTPDEIRKQAHTDSHTRFF